MFNCRWIQNFKTSIAVPWQKTLSFVLKFSKPKNILKKRHPQDLKIVSANFRWNLMLFEGKYDYDYFMVNYDIGL